MTAGDQQVAPKLNYAPPIQHGCCKAGLAGLPAVGARHFLLGLGLTGYLYPSTNLA